MFLLSLMRKQKGLTLMEIMIVAGIITIMAGIAIPRFLSFLEKGKVDAAGAEVETMGSAVREVRKDTGHYAENLDQLDDPSSRGEDFSPWWGPYVSSLPTDIEDPWGTAYVYLFWYTEEDEKEMHLGNFPPGPPGGGWEKGKKKGWGGAPLPPGLWKKLERLDDSSEEGFLLFSCGPDTQFGTADDIEYQTY